MFSWLASNPWAYPALEVLHIVGIALLLGNLVLLELCLWSGATLPLPALARVALPLVLAGFGLCAASGLLMFASQPLDLLGNRAFVIKMGLLVVAGSNAALFHARGGLQRLDGPTMAGAVLTRAVRSTWRAARPRWPGATRMSS